MNRVIAIALFSLAGCGGSVPPVVAETTIACPSTPECVVDEDCSNKPVDCTTGGDASTATAIVPTGTCTDGICEVKMQSCRSMEINKNTH